MGRCIDKVLYYECHARVNYRSMFLSTSFLVAKIWPEFIEKRRECAVQVARFRIDAGDDAHKGLEDEPFCVAQDTFSR